MACVMNVMPKAVDLCDVRHVPILAGTADELFMLNVDNGGRPNRYMTSKTYKKNKIPNRDEVIGRG
jgi:hypothetical protein